MDTGMFLIRGRGVIQGPLVVLGMIFAVLAGFHLSLLLIARASANEEATGLATYGLVLSILGSIGFALCLWKRCHTVLITDDGYVWLIPHPSNQQTTVCRYKLGIQAAFSLRPSRMFWRSTCVGLIVFQPDASAADRYIHLGRFSLRKLPRQVLESARATV